MQQMILGTAQLGMRYGIANEQGKPDQKVSEKILETAILNGILLIDTARAYGDSEEAIGAFLKRSDVKPQVLTKLSPLDELTPQSSITEVIARVDASVFLSCTALNVRCLDVLSLHRAQHLSAWDGAVLRRLRMLRNDGFVKEIGVSVQDPNEAEQALNVEDIVCIQFPFNVLDWRWDYLVPRLATEKSRRPLRLHARSVFLQGLLTSQDESLWAKAHVSRSRPVTQWLQSHTSKFRRLNTKDLCFNYVKSQKWIDGIVVGSETVKQLKENINFLAQPFLKDDEIQSLVSKRPIVALETLNPALWKKE